MGHDKEGELRGIIGNIVALRTTQKKPKPIRGSR